MIGRILRFGFLFCLGLWALAITSPTLLAQEPAGTLAELTVDIWPDFDRPEVLILLTGRVEPGAALPATVTVPLPAEATLNAVARITSDNLMIDDIEFTEGADSVTLVTPDDRFRVEFYIPYATSGDERQFAYRWLAGDLTVDQLIATVQQPAAANTMTVTPEAATIRIGNDGQTYHNLAPLAVPVGEPFTINVVYTADSDLLTVSVLEVAEPPPAVIDPPAEPSSSDINWPVILAAAAGVLVVLVVAWQVVQNRQTRSPARPTRPAARSKPAKEMGRAATPAGAEPRATAVTGRVNFCHQCGQRAQSGDKFCRNCGTALKNN